jgi:hypothetical protein
MNIKSMFTALAITLVVVSAGFVSSSQARTYYNDGYRSDRGTGLFGQGGFLGTGVGRDRYNRTGYDRYGNRYYDSRRPGIVGGAVEATEDVVGGAVNTAGAAVNAANPGNWGRNRRYYDNRRYDRLQELDRQDRMRYNQ